MADLVIRGMEMPKNCFLCRFFREVQDYDGTFGCCLAAKKEINLEINLKFDGCPLVPLPEWHGRLGDLDALISDKSGEATLWCGYEYQDHSVVFEEDIKNAPTIVPAEGD